MPLPHRNPFILNESPRHPERTTTHPERSTTFIPNQFMQRTFTSIFLIFMASFSLAAQTDVHAHIITDSYRSFIDSHKASLDEGFPLPEWSVSAHLAFMDKAGIQTSVLTVPAPQPYFGDAQESAIICRELNEECAAIKSAHPGRFRFFAVLPLQDVDAALA